MPGQNVTITMTADDRDVLRSFQKQQQAILRNQRALLKTGQAGGRAGRQASSAVAGAVSRVKEFVGAFAGIGSSVGGILLIANQLRREIQNIRERQREAAFANLSFEQVLTAAGRNTIGVFTPDQIREMALRGSERTGVDPKKLARAVGAAVTAVGPSGPPEVAQRQAEQAAQTAIEIAAFIPSTGAETVGALTKSAANLRKRFDLSTREAVGFLLKVQQQSNVERIQDVAKFIQPSISNITAALDTRENVAGSLVATLTQKIEDPTGQISSLSGQKFVQEIQKRLVETGLAETTLGGIRLLREDADLRERFFQGGEIGGVKFGEPEVGRGRAEPILKQLVRPGTQTARRFEQRLDTIGRFEEAGGAFDQARSARIQAQPVTGLKRILESAKSRAQLRNITGAQAGVIRKWLRELLQAEGVSVTEQDLISLGFEIETMVGQRDPVQFIVQTLREEAKELRQRTPVRELSFFEALGPVLEGRVITDETGARVVRRTPEELRRAETFRTVADRIDEFRAQQRGARAVNRFGMSREQARRMSRVMGLGGIIGSGEADGPRAGFNPFGVSRNQFRRMAGVMGMPGLVGGDGAAAGPDRSARRPGEKTTREAIDQNTEAVRENTRAVREEGQTREQETEEQKQAMDRQAEAVAEMARVLGMRGLAKQVLRARQVHTE